MTVDGARFESSIDRAFARLKPAATNAMTQTVPTALRR